MRSLAIRSGAAIVWCLLYYTYFQNFIILILQHQNMMRWLRIANLVFNLSIPLLIFQLKTSNNGRHGDLSTFFETSTQKSDLDFVRINTVLLVDPVSNHYLSVLCLQRSESSHLRHTSSTLSFTQTSSRFT